MCAIRRVSQHLWETGNGSMREKFMWGEELLLEFLRTRPKTIHCKKARGYRVVSRDLANLDYY